MPQPTRVRRSAIVFSVFSALLTLTFPLPSGAQDDTYRPPNNGYDSYTPPPPQGDDPNAAPSPPPPYRPGGVYREDDNYRRYDQPNTTARRDDGPGYGEPYHPPGDYDRAPPPPEHGPPYEGYSQNEIIAAGHRFFGAVSEGLASVVEYAFQKQGRPNGYILGEDAGGAFVAGLRYGEGTLYTKDAGVHKVYWQGPSIGYDFGGEGSKTMVLVYNLRDPMQIYERYAGVQGSAYIVGGVGIQFQAHGSVTLAPIRSGIGLRLGANVGYLKYTQEPTWNPF